MNQSGWTYSVLVLFGKETARSIASSKNFSDLSETVAELLMTTGCRVKARGTIDTAKGKNIAPRRGFWSPPLREKATTRLAGDC
jgi:hypothetical protein